MSIRKADAWFRDIDGSFNEKQREIAARILKAIRRAPAIPQQCGARLPDAGAQFRHALWRRKPAYPPCLADRLGPHRRAFTCWMNHPLVCISVIMPACSTRCATCAISVIRSSWSSMSRGRNPHRRLCGRYRPGSGRAWRQVIAQGSPQDIMAKYEFADRQISVRRDGRLPSRPSVAKFPRPSACVSWALRGNNLKNVSADIPLGTLHPLSGRFRRRQVHLPDRDVVQGCVAPHHGVA